MITATAPTSLEPQGTTMAVPSAGTTEESAGFDAILMLQGLAGTAETLEDSLDVEDVLATDDDRDDDGDDEASLAFLANLIAATTPPDSSDEFESGAGGQGANGERGAAPAIALDADSGIALPAVAGDAGDAESEAALALRAVKPELLESRHSQGDASQNLARAVELLSQSRAAVDKLPLTTPVHSPRWADDFSARISLMVRAGESTASLQLTPVDLGPVEVSVSVKDSQATIHFGATQADTRALIEASLPKLRELLASQGFNLLDASVSSGFSRPKQPAFAPSGPGALDSESPVTEVRALQTNGLLDLYA